MKCFLIDSVAILSSALVMLIVPSYILTRNWMRIWICAGWSLVGIDSYLIEAMAVLFSSSICYCIEKLSSLANSRCCFSTSTGVQVKKKGCPNSSMIKRSSITRLETRSEKIIDAHS